MSCIKILCLLLFGVNATYCFNFDTHFPIIYEDAHISLGIHMEKASYFGYTIILYRGNNDTKPWIQIGAPRGTCQDISAEYPGAVFRCPIGRICKNVDIDRYMSGDQTYYDITYTAKVDSAWTGATMDINHDTNRQVICVPRLMTIHDPWTYHMPGACYWSYLNSTNGFKKWLPLIDRANASVVISNVRPLLRPYYYKFGQSGFSAHLTLSKNTPQLLIGAPGVLNWYGSSIIYDNLTETDTQWIWSGNSTEELTGYAVTSGCFFKTDELLYVESAREKATYLGKVTIYAIQRKRKLVRDSKKGSQRGEFFGASLSAGDVNGDGYDDLFVGAPFYKASKNNEGRVYIFYGNSKVRGISSLQIFKRLHALNGAETGAQFGTSVSYMGDFDQDGFGDIAVGAPYAEAGMGKIYIFRGSQDGLIERPAQIITGSEILSGIKGFGISFSNSVDADRNGYNDLAVGAYLSGHAVLLRSRPIIRLRQSVNVWAKKFSSNVTETTEMEVCLWYKGQHLPKQIEVKRTVIIDRELKRVFINMTEVDQNVLTENNKFCRNYTVRAKGNIRNVIEPITVQISQQLLEENRTREPFIVSKSQDKFCETCPIIALDYKDLEKDFLFSLMCGNDDICDADLEFDAKFSGEIKGDEYILGSENKVEMDISVYNRNESAYLTRILVTLPKPVQVRFTPKNCLENGTSLDCAVESPLKKGEQKQLSIPLNLNGIVHEMALNMLEFTVSVETSSENRNPVKSKNFTLKLRREADLQLTGKSNEQFYVFGNNNNSNSTFSQDYYIQKIGKSPIREVIFNLDLPTSINTSTGAITFVKVISHLGTLANQPITCENLTHIEYITDTRRLKAEEVINAVDPELETETTTTRMLQKHDSNLEPENIPIGEAPKVNRNIFNVSGENSEINSAKIRCRAGPFQTEQDIAVIQIKAVLYVGALQTIIGKRNQIILTTNGSLEVPNFTQSGDLPDNERVMSIFIAWERAPIKTWIIIVSIIAGLFILLILVLTLIKMGFFSRKKKQELEVLKHKEAVEELEKNAKLSVSQQVDFAEEDNDYAEINDVSYENITN